MAVHNAYDREFFCPTGSVKTSGGSMSLAAKQIALVDMKTQDNADGLKIVYSLTGLPTDDKRYEIRQGRNVSTLGRSDSDKDWSTPMFAINEVIRVEASAPKTKEEQVDEVIFGYNGIDPDTTITARKGDRITLKLTLSGLPIELAGYMSGEYVIEEDILFDDCPSIPDPCTDCDPCETVDILPAVLETIERLKGYRLMNGETIGDYVDITPIHECDVDGNTRPTTNIYTYCIEACDTGNGGALSALQQQYPNYKIERVDRVGSITKYQTITTQAKPADYTQTLGSVLPTCGECPDDYTLGTGGYVYAINLHDAGEDMSGEITIPNQTEVTKTDSQQGGMGVYIAVLSAKLTDAQIATFIEDNPTAVVRYIGETVALCENSTVTTIPWTACGQCEVSTDTYTITMPDDLCGESALAELQAAYPELTITEVTRAGCQGMFSTEVPTSQVCPECDPIYEEFFKSEPPVPYRGRNWKLDEENSNTIPSTCKVGIRFKGKTVLISPSECVIDKMGYSEGSTQIAVSGGYPDEIREGINIYYNPIHTEYVRMYAPRTHVAGNLYYKERGDYVYFEGAPMHDRYIERALTGEEYSMTDFRDQIADIAIVIRPVYMSQGLSKHNYSDIRFHFYVPYGQHQDILDFVNNLATAAGVAPVTI